MKLLEMEDISFVYSPRTPFERKVLNGVSLSLEEGEILLVTGKNGSGKSTLLQIAAVLMRPSSGAVKVMGNDAWEKPRDARRWIGYSFQFPESQFFEMSVYDEVLFAPKNYGLKDLEERYKKAMDIVGLDPDAYRNVLPFSLSGGEKRKVALASIISHDPKVLVLDEPLVGLDVPSREEILDFLRKWKEMGKSALVATHRIEEFKRIADDVMELKGGG